MTVSIVETPPTAKPGRKHDKKRAATQHENSKQSSNSKAQSDQPAVEQHKSESQQNDNQKQQSWLRKKRSWFSIFVACIIIAWTFGVEVPKAAKDERVRAAVSDSVQRLNTTLVEQFDVSIDGFLETLANLSDTVSNILPGGDDLPRPGQLAAKEGLKAHHPVIIIPGFVTSGLELWQGEECAQSYFRQRLWGTLSMAQTLLSDRACWMRHMKLDPVTGSDPPGIKLRAAKALEAVDYFVPGYWVFSKMVQSLADLGYDNNNLVAVPYDWRLPIPVMETRDGYFSRVKIETEMQFRLSKGIKPVMVSHSYGAQVSLAFLHWVEKKEPGWVDKHLHGYINLAGPMLGLPKALSPLLSGETRETVDMMAGLAVLVEQYLGKQSRAALFRTWGSVLAMLPVGGPEVWGNATHAPDDDPQVTKAGRSYGGIIALVRTADSKLRDAVRKNDSSLISNDSLKLLTTTLSNWGNMVKSLGSSASTEDDSEDSTDNDKATSDNENSDEALDRAAASEKGKNPVIQAEEVTDGDAALSVGPDQQVRFLDVHSTLLSLAATAGEQLTRNMQRWSAEAKSLNLSQVLAHHRRTAQQLAAQRDASCKVDPSQAGEYQGRCKGDAAAAADNDDNNNGSGPGCERNDSSCKGASQRGSCSSSIDGADDDLANDVTMSHAGGDHRSTGTEDATGSEVDEVTPVNPVTTPLPNAPNFKLYCFYGIGTPTERGYHYLKTKKNGAMEWSINNMVDDPASGLVSGVQLSPDGDGTVPLLSLGALCAGGWKTRRLNPGGSDVIVREYPNNPVPVFKDSRGGPEASTHVEILGNEPMLRDLLQVVAGKGEGMEEVYHTNIRSIASKIPWDEL